MEAWRELLTDMKRTKQMAIARAVAMVLMRREEGMVDGLSAGRRSMRRLWVNVEILIRGSRDSQAQEMLLNWARR